MGNTSCADVVCACLRIFGWLGHPVLAYAMFLDIWSPTSSTGALQLALEESKNIVGPVDSARGGGRNASP
jgi:hypothetical protein